MGRVKPLLQANLVSLQEANRGQQLGAPEPLDLTEVNAPSRHTQLAKQLVRDNNDLFAQSDLDLGKTSTVTMRIDTGNHPPIRSRPYRTPLQKRVAVDKAIDEMLEAGIIRPSRSPWSFPVVMVDKKDKTKRFCVDFRRLNKIPKQISYPLPLIDDILALQGRAKIFSTLDLRSGYWQVPVHEQDQEKVSFVMHRGFSSTLCM